MQDKKPVEREKRPPLDFPLIHVSSCPANLSIRCEDLYGDREEEFNLNKYVGVIKLTQDPLEYQQQIRDE